MFTIKKNTWNNQSRKERVTYRGYVAIEYMHDGRMVIWSGNKSYTM